LAWLQVLEKQKHRYGGIGKNYFPYMSCFMWAGPSRVL